MTLIVLIQLVCIVCSDALLDFHIYEDYRCILIPQNGLCIMDIYIHLASKTNMVWICVDRRIILDDIRLPYIMFYDDVLDNLHKTGYLQNYDNVLWSVFNIQT